MGKITLVSMCLITTKIKTKNEEDLLPYLPTAPQSQPN